MCLKEVKNVYQLMLDVIVREVKQFLNIFSNEINKLINWLIDY